MSPEDPQSADSPDLRPKMILGSFWMMGINLFRRGIGVISTVILARLLPPEDFGLVAMASVLLVMVQALTEFGFDVALIQKQNADRSHYDTAWTFKVIFGTASALLLVSMALPMAEFYSEPRISAIILALSVGVFLRGFENVGIVNFRKNFEFNREFQFYTSIKFAAFVVTISLALIFRSYWALVTGMVTSRVMGLILSYALHDYRPRFSIAARRELFSFSIWLFLNNILLFVRTRGADFIVGRILGPTNLGLFTIGSEIASLPTTELIAPINRAIFPGYSKISNDLNRLREAFLNVFSVIAMVAIPAATGIAVISKTAIPFLLGPNWSGAIPLVHTLAFVGLLTSLHSNTGVAYIALGKPRIHVVLQTISALILLPTAVIFAQRIGIVGVAYAYLLANSTTFVINIFVAVRLIEIRPARALASVFRPIVAALLMYAVVDWMQDELAGAVPLAVNLLASMVSGGVLFASVVLFLWLISGRPRGAEVIAIEYARKVPFVRGLANRLLSKSATD